MKVIKTDNLRADVGRNQVAKAASASKWVFHHTSTNNLPAIQRQGLAAGSFSSKPIAFTGNIWLAANLADLPNQTNLQSHSYGKVVAYEVSYGEGSQTPIPPDKLFIADAKGKILMPLLQWKPNKMAAYSNETGYLNSYMKQGFDPYDFGHALGDYLERNGEMTPDMEEMNEDGDWTTMMEKWLATATPQDQKNFQEFAVTGKHVGQMPTEEPAYLHMSHQKMVPATWLVHFTDDAETIASKGFKYGFDGDGRFEGLAVTTHFKERKVGPGYNFAFLANSRDMNIAARDHKYGSEAVVFWSSAVQVAHYGDNEEQLVFWGPQVSPTMIFAVTHDTSTDQWTIPMHHNNRPFKSESLGDCVNWITQHHGLLLQDKNAAQKVVENDKRKGIRPGIPRGK